MAKRRRWQTPIFDAAVVKLSYKASSLDQCASIMPATRRRLPPSMAELNERRWASRRDELMLEAWLQREHKVWRPKLI